jgi:hypothetical protein
VPRPYRPRRAPHAALAGEPGAEAAPSSLGVARCGGRATVPPAEAGPRASEAASRAALAGEPSRRLPRPGCALLKTRRGLLAAEARPGKPPRRGNIRCTGPSAPWSSEATNQGRRRDGERECSRTSSSDGLAVADHDPGARGRGERWCASRRTTLLPLGLKSVGGEAVPDRVVVGSRSRQSLLHPVTEN